MSALRSQVTVDDLDRMTGKLYITQGADRARKWSAFWVLLVLAAVIASAGVAADSTATVIGAMIVAPLMTPILGTAVAVVLGHRRQVLQCVGLVLGGALVVVVIGYLLGAISYVPIEADTNSQVAGRVSPRLIDLIAALATGAVGAFALVRSDVSDTLPGVAIAISLVPPLAVVGLTLEAGKPEQSLGALLLFGTNVGAIIATGTAVLVAYRVREVALAANRPVGALTGRTLAAVVGFLVVLAVPLTFGTIDVVRQQQIINAASPLADGWAADQGWQVVEVAYRQDVLRVVAVGPPPEADAQSLRAALDGVGLEDVDVRVTLIVGGSRDLPAGRP